MSAKIVPAEAVAEGDLSPQFDSATVDGQVSAPRGTASIGARHDRQAIDLCRGGLESTSSESTDAESTNEASVRESRDILRQRQGIVAFKFGGTSLLGAERMLRAAELVKPVARCAHVVVVVSAMKGVTDRLLALAQLLAERRNQRARADAEALLRLHHDVLRELALDVEAYDRVSHELDSLGRDLLHEVPMHERVAATPEIFDRLASFGERFSARLFAAALERSGVAAVPVASSEFVLTCDTFRDAKPHLEQTKLRGRDLLIPLLAAAVVPVVTGFIGATPDGRITTLGRNSSDFSGAIIAHVLDADELVIWTDVDGIYTANPNESVQARLLQDLSYDEAHALAASGAKVLHPHVLPLAAETKMTVWVRNTFKPQARGTRIGLSRRSRSLSQQSQQEGAA
jgi:bifunctional aspartokinase / homoserine dehydrogenase 1